MPPRRRPPTPPHCSDRCETSQGGRGRRAASPHVLRSKKRKVDPARDRTWNLRFRRPAPYPLGHRTLCRRKLSSCVRGEIALDFMRSSGKLKILTRTRRVDFWSAKFDVIAGLIAYFNLRESYAFQSQHGPVPFACGCLLYTSPSPRDQRGSRMPSSA